MTATTATTIQGVWVLTTQPDKERDLFDIQISSKGIELRRDGQPPERMGWEGISEWEVEERPKGVVLILRGGGATTPIAVPGWAPGDMEALLRQVTTNGPTAQATRTAAPALPATHRLLRQRRRRERRARWARALPWKPVLTVVLLGVLAAAVTVVLLQSAGIINWGFLGPTA